MIHHETPHEPPAASARRPGLLDAPPKTTFVLGLFVGAAATAIVALLLILPRLGNTPGSTATAGTNSNVAGATDTSGQEAPPTQPTEDATKIAKPSSADYYRGVAPDKAKVVLVEYSDYQCPFCSRFHPTMKRVMEDYQGQVSWVYRHFPLSSIHPNAQPAAEAAECVGELGGRDKFWEFTDKLFENQSQLSASYYTELAKQLKIDEKKFNACVSAGKYAQKISASEAEASSAGVNGTPGTFIMKGTDLATGRLIAGAYPIETVKQTIDALLQ